MARVQALRTILFFGALIGAVLLAVQALSLRGSASGDAGWTAGATGLAFLVAGAENHFRSVNTIKTQVAQIYAKLGVSGRVQAVERARELRLLE